MLVCAHDCYSLSGKCNSCRHQQAPMFGLRCMDVKTKRHLRSIILTVLFIKKTSKRASNVQITLYGRKNQTSSQIYCLLSVILTFIKKTSKRASNVQITLYGRKNQTSLNSLDWCYCQLLVWGSYKAVQKLVQSRNVLRSCFTKVNHHFFNSLL